MASTNVVTLMKEKQFFTTKMEASETNNISASKKPMPAPRPSIILRKSSNSIYPSISKTEKNISKDISEDSPNKIGAKPTLVSKNEKNVSEDIFEESPSKIDAKTFLVSVEKELQCYICLSLPRPGS